MNPVLVLLIILGAILLWFLLSFSFGFFGKFTNRLKDDAKKAMFEDENNDIKGDNKWQEKEMVLLVLLL